MFIKGRLKNGKNIEIIFKEYKRSFNDGFMPLLNKYLRFIDEEYDDIFIDYMFLALPYSKVIQIFNEIYWELINKPPYISIIGTRLNMILIDRNKVFCLICRAIEQAFFREDITIS